MRPIRAARSAAAVLSVLTTLLSPAAAHADAAPRHAAPDNTVTLPVRDALAALPVQTENRAGYERTMFKHWTDADKNGCNPRAEVLIEEAVTAPVQGPTVR